MNEKEKNNKVHPANESESQQQKQYPPYFETSTPDHVILLDEDSASNVTNVEEEDL
ncbi:hypothetical protein [Metabacillus arenae]|uniref:Uncharacterized protein n=1 Tax=Metabacillus arenae TaxID=2771434 RepID=A0A926NCM9_9BACI|nr:hypothetical protein [Metabacillus arenae]MBD1378761.1 hypothetical protein [Metabacillus arenae]